MDSPRLFGYGASMVLHAGAIVVMVWGVPRPAPESVKSPGAAPMGIAVPDARSVEVTGPDISPPSARAPSELHIGEFRFDYRKIAERPTALFPFLTRALPPERTTLAARRSSSGGFMYAPEPAIARRAARPLILTDKALQQLVDKAWSRRERWTPFRRIATLVTAHGPDDDRVLTLLRAYRDQNVLQPYVGTSPDAARWVMLGIAADHGDFMDFIGEYASRHPSSKVTTELLFLLDELAHGSFDALSVLLDTRGHDLWWTRESNREAYHLFVALQEHYRAQLRKRGVAREALGAYYDSLRLNILSQIVRTSPDGYRINDAWFLSGAIYWNQGRRAEALKVWRRIASDPSDVYAQASAELSIALRGSVRDAGSEVDAREVDRILDAEKSRWLASSSLRLARFGYTVDTF